MSEAVDRIPPDVWNKLLQADSAEIERVVARLMLMGGNDWESDYRSLVRSNLSICKKSPIVKKRARALRRATSGDDPVSRVRTPSDAIAERHLLLGLFLAHGEVPEMRGIKPELFRYTFAVTAATAELFLWTERMRETAQAMKLPPHVIGAEGWPYAIMWWTFECGLELVDPEKGSAGTLQSALLARTPDGVRIWLLCDNEEQSGQLTIQPDFIKFGTRIDPKAGRISHDVIKMVAFLNSKYISVEPRQMKREERRQCFRANLPNEAQTTVRVVTLRSKESDSQSPNSEGDRDWAWRWWVRGHIRAQWCPSTKTHKLIYIAPHLKGPEDKPILQKVYAVAR